jgi:hypothetical protein
LDKLYSSRVGKDSRLAREELFAKSMPAEEVKMFWSEVLGCILEVIPSLLEMVVTTHEFQSRSLQPSQRTDSDDWKCPGAAEIAKVVGGPAETHAHVFTESTGTMRELK